MTSQCTTINQMIDDGVAGLNFSRKISKSTMEPAQGHRSASKTTQAEWDGSSSRHAMKSQDTMQETVKSISACQSTPPCGRRRVLNVGSKLAACFLHSLVSPC
eukprot:59551-Hanusia_phi.AAC.2